MCLQVVKGMEYLAEQKFVHRDLPPWFCVYRKEIKEWSKVMIERMKDLKPLVACFNGKGKTQLSVQ